MGTAPDRKAPLDKEQASQLLDTLKARFLANMGRHPDWTWEAVEARLLKAGDKLTSLLQMEQTGGEPDVVQLDGDNSTLVFADCAKESPLGRRSLCYDEQALAARKLNKPAGSAQGLASQMGIQMMDELQYRALQRLGEFDLKSSSWVKTPELVRSLGGAFFCDRRYDTVFVYHNGADSYYSGRAFRGLIQI